MAPTARPYPLVLVSLPAALLLACSEYKVADRPDYSGTVTDPVIGIDPDALDFDAMAPGTAEDRSFRVSNQGGADLVVDTMALEGSGAFTFAGVAPPYTLAPGDGENFVVSFSPANAEDQATLHVVSNDPGNPDALVPLQGGGLYPQLLIVPDPYDFGRVPDGCTASTEVLLQNVGLAPLTIDSAVAVGAGYAAVADAPFPVVLDPGGELPIVASFAPGADTAGARFWVTSDDPAGIMVSDWSGEGSATNEIVDRFSQGVGEFDRTDILLYVDQSGSMSDDQANLGANAALLADALAAADMDWQLIVTNDDDGCHAGDILTSESPDAASQLSAQVQRGGGGWTEAGLTVSLNALQEAGSGGCNEGFLREDARTILVLVSDEPEQSARAWDDMLSDVLRLAPTTAIVAIVGDLPRGCSTAEPGSGYVEASIATGGEFLSICSADWGSYFGTIAGLSGTALQRAFALSNNPDPDTIVVTVSAVVNEEWAYEASLNSVIFPVDAMPEAGAPIEVTYRLAADCAQ